MAVIVILSRYTFNVDFLVQCGRKISIAKVRLRCPLPPKMPTL